MRSFSSFSLCASFGVPLALLVAGAACGHHPEDEDGARGDAGKGGATALPGAPAPAPVAAAPVRGSSETWNAAQIEWLPFDDGARLAKEQNKPILLVVYTTWCPHCRNYSHVFDDPRVVQHAHDFVMIRIDADAQPDVASRYARDGGYIPRTYFLAPDGTANAAIHAPQPRYQFFYDEHDPKALLASMDAELITQRR